MSKVYVCRAIPDLVLREYNTNVCGVYFRETKIASFPSRDIDVFLSQGGGEDMIAMLGYRLYNQVDGNDAIIDFTRDVYHYLTRPDSHGLSQVYHEYANLMDKLGNTPEGELKKLIGLMPEDPSKKRFSK